MKKFIMLVAVMLVCLTGCGKEGKITCTLTSKDVTQGYELESEYNINYKGELVESVDTVETVKTDSEDLLDYFEEYLNTTYSKMDETYGGYTYKVTKSDDKVESKVTIDYNKMDVDQFVKDQPSLKSYVKDSKIKVDGLKEMYETMGAECSE